MSIGAAVRRMLPAAIGSHPGPDRAAPPARADERPAPPPRRRSELAPGTVVGARYRIDGVLARGGMGVVHTAFDPFLLRDVVVKVLDAPAVQDRTTRGAAWEGVVAATVSHPALMPVLDAGTVRREDGTETDFLVMERMRGGDLHALLARRPLRWDQAAALGAELAEGLALLHGAGLVHRDVKPANVLIATVDPDERLRARLADFGTAIGAVDLAPGPDLGTVAYMCPEQVRGRRATDRSDVYSLGLVLLEAVTGHREFPGSVDESALARLRREPFLPPDLPARFAEVLRGMTATTADRRPPAEEVARRLAACATGPGGSAAPDATLERLRTSATLAARLTGAVGAAVLLPDATGTDVLAAPGHLRVPRRLDGDGWPRTHPSAAWTVDDLAADPVVSEHALLAAGVRAAAGVPIPGDRPGAMLCVFEDRPRHFSGQAVRDLVAVASMLDLGAGRAADRDRATD
ncbi:serine/threonine-protein kinase [Amnibacterium kyonggiense]|uniref:non-specific serine/threonine protein kinase n=1 Tax=Amnibacterium kyonggiense TaxID=595671 RepID=A0A4R7FKJ1_9MICO|nr:serine/threonine-protein kinase [Amnibacterium kyonggiense]TDS76872.1 serine/threonine protein kinase [Amnibacterium kyonggiense]